MEPEEFGELLQILRSGLEDGSFCWFAYWVGWSFQHVGLDEHGHDVNERATRYETAGGQQGNSFPQCFIGDREYVLCRTSVAGVRDGLHAGAYGHQPPDLCWAADRSWFVYSDVELNSTLVGATDDLVASLIAAPGLEAFRITAESEVS